MSSGSMELHRTNNYQSSEIDLMSSDFKDPTKLVWIAVCDGKFVSRDDTDKARDSNTDIAVIF